MLLPENSPALVARLARAREEVRYLAPCLEGARSLLDIGCGAAITSILLYKELGLDHLYLMDGGPLRMREESWFEHAPVPWSDMDLPRSIAKMNDVSFSFSPPDPDLSFDVDAIISLLSWGHHYPARVYLPLARRSLPLGGRLVLDLRQGKNGADAMLAAGFRMVAQLDETEKLRRYCFERVN